MSFFYADIKTDELKVHGHTNSIPGQIEILDAASSNMVILKAPDILPSNVTLTLPKSNGSENDILTAADNEGSLGFITVNGDITLEGAGLFTVNGISNTSTIQSTANIVLAGTNSIYFADANVGLRAPDNGNLAIAVTSNMILEKGASQMVFDIGETNTYVNFSNIVGETGYGIKTNNGIMQYKNTIDTEWSNIGSGGGSSTLAGLTDVALSGLANNNILVYDTSDYKWHNEAITSGYYASFSDTTIQTNNAAPDTNAYNIMRLNTTNLAYGMYLQNNSQVVVSHSSIYKINFTAQFDKTDAGDDIVNTWLLKNGSNMPNTDTEITVVGNNGKFLASWSYITSLVANDYIELAWKSLDSGMRLFSQPAIFPAPAIPSVILNIHQVAYVLGGTSNFFAELLDVNTSGKTGNSLVQYNVSTSKWDAVSNLTLNNGNYIKLGTTGNICGSNGGNVTINSGNVDVVVSGEAHIHNNLRVTGNIFFDGNYLSNISAPVGGNLNISASNVNILSTAETKLTGPIRMENTVYFDGGYLANIMSPSAGNLIINAGNLDIIPTNHLNILGNTHIPYSNSRLAFGDQSTYIQSPVTGNLDIHATAGNVNINANHDVIITTNSASTIRLVGPNGSSPVNISFNGSCSYINFGTTTGESGTGIKYNGTNVAVGSGGSWAGISNTTLSIAGRTVELGGSNTIGFTNLTGIATNSQLANSSITIGSNTIALGSTISGLGLNNSFGYLASNLVGTITNAQLAGFIDNSKLANTSIIVGTNTLTLGRTVNGLNLSSSNSYNTANLVGAVNNSQLANSTVTIGSSVVALGGSTIGSLPHYVSFIFPAAPQNLGVAALQTGIVSNNVISLTESLNDVTGWATNTYKINGLIQGIYRIKAHMCFQSSAASADPSFWIQLHEGNSSVANNPRYISAQGSCYGTGAASTTSFECIRDYRTSLPANVNVLFGNQLAAAAQLPILSCTLVCERLYNIY